MLSILYTVSAAILLRIFSYLLPLSITDMYAFVGCTLLNLIVIYNCYHLARKWFGKGRILAHNKAVLITGCDSGFGNELAKRLDAKGFHVFASCLAPEKEGAKSLVKACSSRLKVLPLDVTKEDSVADAVKFVRENLNAAELWAIVNNAGVLCGLSVELSPMEDFQKCIDVNALGPVRVTKAFLPLLPIGRGRVVNVTSLAGRLSLPHLTPYVMSKFAATAFSDSLRLELASWGIKVISIEPEGYKTKLITTESAKNDLAKLLQDLDEDVKEQYGEDYFRTFGKCREFLIRLMCERTYQVVDCCEDALTLKHPEIIYRPSRNFVISLICRVYENFPSPVRDSLLKFLAFIFQYPIPKEAENRI